MVTAATAKAPAKPKPTPKPKTVTSTPFKSVEDIRLGMKVRDPASGLTGIASFRSQQLSGTVQYAIQPQGDGDTIPEGHFVDDFMLEFVDDGVSARTPAADPNARYILGEKLKDTVTGFTGIAVERVTYLNGCVHYTLQPHEKKKSLVARLINDPARATHFDFKRLEKIDDGVVEKTAKKPTPPAAEAKPAEPAPFKRSTTGGPSRSMREAGFR